MTTFEHVLDGCAPAPLAGYLKALGVLRLVAEQRDHDARGFWRHERFVLTTRLSRDELVRFFLNDYTPTPVISPWNGGSGFYFREGKTKDKDPKTGKRIKSGVRDEATAATRALDVLLQSTSPRFEIFRRATEEARKILSTRGLDSAPDDTEKADLILELRSAMPDEVLNWLDAAALVTINATGVAREPEIAFPPLLGSGGNDGNLDFSTTFLQMLFSVIDADTGSSKPEALQLLHCALFSEAAQIGNGVAISQFSPGATKSPNSGVGFSGNSPGNGWDVVLGLEGTLVFSAAAVRRIGARSERGEASFPFMLTRRGAFGAGSGQVSIFDEQTARGEFWAPIWNRPMEYHELLSLFREGRAVVERKIASNTLDFARALGQLGVDRGISVFERYAFEQRFGNMYLGVPLTRYRVARNSNADLIADLAIGGWLDRARASVRGKNAPASLVSLGNRFDEILLKLATDSSFAAVQEALIVVGQVVCEIGRRPNLRGTVPPPPRLSAEWISAAEDGSPEFTLATALASLDAATRGSEFRLPFRRHLGPLGWPDGRESWRDNSEAKVLAVWTGRDLVRDLLVVLERRLIEAQRWTFIHERGGAIAPSPELPLRGRRIAPLAAVAAFLAHRTDDDRIAKLAAGLAWVRMGGRGSSPGDREDALPFFYAALKPLFEADGIGLRPEIRRIIDPLLLVRLLRARRLHEAVRLAQHLARSAGLSAPFARLYPAGAASPWRLAASLLFPIAPMAQHRLIARAYPDLKRTEEEPDAA